MTKRTKTISIIIGVFLLGALVLNKISSNAHQSGGGKPDGKPASAQSKGSGKSPGETRSAQPVLVGAVRLVPAVLASAFGSAATLVAERSAELRCEATGRITSITFTEGARVKAGTVLLQLNNADLMAQLDKALAVSALAQQRLVRQQELFDKQMVSQEDVQSAEKDALSAQADIRLLRAQIDKTHIVAPFDGTVGLRELSVGAYVSAGTKVTDLVDRTKINIDCAIPERLVAAVRVGTVLRFTVRTSGTAYLATVYALDPAIDEATRTLRIRARCTNADAALVPGLSARIEFSTQSAESTLSVPTVSLVQDISGERVFVVRGGIATAVAVRSGVRTETAVQLLSGVSAGDTVVTDGAALLRSASAVTIKTLD